MNKALIKKDTDNLKKSVEEKKENKRSIYWDIVKAVGIISVVIGHVTSFEKLHDFVYLYHLVVFYFISTFFYNEYKYGDKPFDFFAKRLKDIWLKYVIYTTIIVILHNVFLKYNFYYEVKLYAIRDFVQSILKKIIMQRTEQFEVPFWFVSNLLITNGLFGAMIYFSRKVSDIINKKDTFKHIALASISILLGILGIVLNIKKIKIDYHLQISFLVLPICTLGYYFKLFLKKDNIKKRISNIVNLLCILIISLLIMFFIIFNTELKIDLSRDIIANGYWFYFVSIVGLCFILSLSKLIEKIPIINTILSIIGKHSFAIMAMHCICVKAVDVLYSKIIGESDLQKIAHLIVTYPEKLLIIYIIVGTIIPVIISIGVEYIIKISRHFLLRNKENYDKIKYNII